MKNDEFQKYGEIKIIIEGNNNLTIRMSTEASYIKDKEKLIKLLDSNINDHIAKLCDDTTAHTPYKPH